MSMTSSQDKWNAQLYDTKHAFVSAYGTQLIELLQAQPGERILDVGCGTGDLAKQLYDQQVYVVGVDQSANMIQQAKQKYPEIIFHVKDATTLDYTNDFDAVFSNATLHWVKPPKQALASIYNSLKTGGRFVAEFGGKGNVQMMTDAILHECLNFGIDRTDEQFPWYYPSIGEYTSLMEEIGFRVTFAQHYDRPTPLAGEDGLQHWIAMFGGAMLDGIPQAIQETMIANVVKALKPIMYNGHDWIADYKRIRVISVKA